MTPTQSNCLVTMREESVACKHCPGVNAADLHSILREGNCSSTNISPWRQVTGGWSVAYLSFSASQDGGCEGPITAWPTGAPCPLQALRENLGVTVSTMTWEENQPNPLHWKTSFIYLKTSKTQASLYPPKTCLQMKQMCLLETGVSSFMSSAAYSWL